VYDKEDGQVLKFPYYEDTRSINFEDMLDSENNPIFASLSESGKGGDTIDIYSFNEKYRIHNVIYVNLSIKTIDKDKDLHDIELQNGGYKVIGIQKWLK